MFNLKRDAPWFFQHLENYYHLFLNVRFNNGANVRRDIKFSVELNLQGFEGLLFYMYKPDIKKVSFNLSQFRFKPGNNESIRFCNNSIWLF